MSPSTASDDLAAFEEAETKQIAIDDDDGIPVLIDEDTDATRPVDVGEMEAAAQRSRLVPDPTEPPRLVPRRDTSTGEPAHALTVTIAAAGRGRLESLAPHRLTPSGMSFSIPPGRELTLHPGAAVSVHLQRAESLDRPPLDLTLRASVAHVRPARKSMAGGLSIRWVDEEAARLPAALDRRR